MAENLMKVPAKGILKNSTSFEGSSTASKCSSSTRGTKWDEMNILATLHPPDKDYGHMRIEEPKTPFSYQGEDSGDEGEGRDLDSKLLAEKLVDESILKRPEAVENAEEEEDDEIENLEDEAKRRSFENKRKAHYNEFMAVKLARQLMEKDEDIDEDEEGNSKNVCEDVAVENEDSGESDIPAAAIDDEDSKVNVEVPEVMDTKEESNEELVQLVRPLTSL